METIRSNPATTTERILGLLPTLQRALSGTTPPPRPPTRRMLSRSAPESRPLLSRSPPMAPRLIITLPINPQPVTIAVSQPRAAYFTSWFLFNKAYIVSMDVRIDGRCTSYYVRLPRMSFHVRLRYRSHLDSPEVLDFWSSNPLFDETDLEYFADTVPNDPGIKTVDLLGWRVWTMRGSRLILCDDQDLVWYEDSQELEVSMEVFWASLTDLDAPPEHHNALERLDTLARQRQSQP